MASGYTENYGLCQWEPGDPFRRAEFNSDNARVDAALRRTAAQVERLEYNVYNLALQDYYEGRHTGWKKGLLFDGFADEGGIGKMDQQLLCNGALELTAQGQGDLELGVASPRRDEWSGGPWTAAGSGLLTGFRCKFYSGVAAESIKPVEYVVSVNGVVQCKTTASLTIPGGGAESMRTITLPEPVKLSEGDAFSLKVVCPKYWEVFANSESSGLGGTVYITPKSGQSGVMTSVAYPLPASQGLMAWVRFSGGNVALSVVEGGGKVHPMTPDGDRETVDLHGEVCTERAFRLEEPLGAGGWAVRLSLSLGGAGRMAVCDYGVVLL